MPAKKKSDEHLVALAISLPILGILSIVMVAIVYWIQVTSVQASTNNGKPPSVIIPAVITTNTNLPTPYYLPTVTPNMRSTEVVLETPTPFKLSIGPKPVVIGKSVSGRPLEVYIFGSGNDERMIIAGIHGGYEWNTIALADELIKYITDHPETIPPGVRLYILRNMNPDGDARDHGIDGRVNDHGVDLNRNFPVNWAAKWDRDGCFDATKTTGGPSPASEPETQAVVSFLSNHKVTAVISYHSAALGVFPGGEPWDPTSIKLARQIAGVSDYPYPPIDTGCVYTGTLADFAVSKGSAAVDMELTDHKHTDFAINLKVLKVLLTFDPNKK
jgi:hypothetical protein